MPLHNFVDAINSTVGARNAHAPVSGDRGGTMLNFSHGVTYDLPALAAEWNIDLDVNNAATLGVILAAAEYPNAKYNIVGTSPAVVTMSPTVNETTGAGITNDHLILAMVLSTRVEAAKWIFDLVAASQNKHLKVEHVSSYLEMVNAEKVNRATLRELVIVIARDYPDILSSDALRARISNNRFMEMHTQYASASSLLTKMIADLGASANLFFTAGTITAVANANARKFDRVLADAIPQNAMALCMAYNNVNGSALSDWVQGRRAVESIPPYLFQKYRRVFGRMKEIGSGLVDLTTALTIADVVAAAIITPV